jgi:hypothetical protein
MNPEELHRKKLKEIGYSDESIEDIVERCIKNCFYEFAIAYHDEMSKYSQTLVSGSFCEKCNPNGVVDGNIIKCKTCGRGLALIE